MTIAIIGATSFLAQALFKKWNTVDTPPTFHCYSRQELVVETPNQWIEYAYPNTPLDIATLLEYTVIYFCAGAGIQPKHSDDQQRIYGLNAFEPIQLAVALEAANYQGKLVTFGSYFEIGDQPEKLAYTTAALASHRNPLPNAYCQAKNLLTRFADSKLLPTANPLPYTWQHFILTNIYGAQENSKRLIPYIVQSSFKGEDLEFTAGVQQRQYTHIEDIAHFLITTVQQSQTGVFNLTAPEVYTVRTVIEQVLTAVEQRLGQRPQVQFGALDKRDVNMQYLALDVSQQPTGLTFEPQINLEQGIQEYLDHYAPNKV
ncbi:MAG: NAD-dependent epimerase/dehydratase family protein [Aureispira sp.]